MKDSLDILERAVASIQNVKPDDIARLMKRRHISGRPATTGGCPLAMYLSRAFGGRFIVGRKFIARQVGDKVVKIKTPTNMSNFIRKFDLSGYPLLLAPPPRCIAKHVKLTAGKPDTRKGDRHKIITRPRRHLAEDVGRLVAP